MTIPLWKRLLGKEEIWMSRPWDLTEIVPVHETFWFRLCAGIIGFFLIAVLLVVSFS
jgi:hypothetical protein